MLPQSCSILNLTSLSTQNMYSEITTTLERIEAKLDALLQALAEEDEETLLDLDGNPMPGEREPHQSLD